MRFIRGSWCNWSLVADVIVSSELPCKVCNRKLQPVIRVHLLMDVSPGVDILSVSAHPLHPPGQPANADDYMQVMSRDHPARDAQRVASSVFGATTSAFVIA